MKSSGSEGHHINKFFRDLDQIKDDLLSPRHLAIYKETKAAEDLPGLGRNYCVQCAKWFDTEQALGTHNRGKPHKRRLKQLKEGAYTHKEADAAGGLWIDNGKGKPDDAPHADVDMMT